MRQIMKSIAIIGALLAPILAANQFGEAKLSPLNNMQSFRYLNYAADTLTTGDTLFITKDVNDTANRFFNCLDVLESGKREIDRYRSTPDSLITIYQATSVDADAIGLIITHQFATRETETSNIFTETNVAADTVAIATGVTTIQRFARKYWPGTCLRQLFHLSAATDNVKVLFLRNYLQYPGD